MTITTSFTSPINGTGTHDILIGHEGGSNTDHVIRGFSGNDLIIGDHDYTFEDTAAANNTFAGAVSIDSPLRWSRQENRDVGNDSVPYTTVVGEGTGNNDYFSVTIGAGQTIRVDLDYGNTGNNLGGSDFDGVLSLFDIAQVNQRNSDDANARLGGDGSFRTGVGANSQDPYLTYTSVAGGTYYIKVGDYNTLFTNNNGPIAVGDTYMLNVSVTNHSNSNIAGFGHDTLIGGGGNDRIYGGGGNDRLFGDAGEDDLYGGDGRDFLSGGARDDRLYGGDGVDRLGGGNGMDLLAGNKGNDIMNGGNHDDVLMGGLGRDNLKGSAGNDRLDGGDANDRLNGGSGNDRMFGRDGNDTMFGLSGNDVMLGNNGRDTLNGGNDNDRMYGGNGADTLNGGSGNDRMEGGAQNDVLIGSRGNDTLSGDSGRDNLIGGLGDDVLTGGSSRDFFTYGNNFDRDVIRDFNDNQDELNLNDNLWSGNLNVQQVLNQFAFSNNGRTTFDFGSGDLLILNGVADYQTLLNDITII